MTKRDARQFLPSGDPAVELPRYEEELALHIKDFVQELCLTDASILTDYISRELHGNIEDLVESSAELFFHSGTLRYGYAAETDIVWGELPAIMLEMELVTPAASVFFTLVTNGLHFGTSIERVLMTSTGNDETDFQLYAQALSQARNTPLPTPP